jgi:hypothetical protein
MKTALGVLATLTMVVGGSCASNEVNTTPNSKPTTAGTVDPCAGRSSDKLDHPKGATGLVSKPTAGQSYVDPVFGTRITRVGNADPAEGTNAIVIALYNSMRGWNADSSQIIAWHRAGARTYEFYQGDTPYAHLGQIVFGGAFSDNTWPADIEHIAWDSENPSVLYYPAYDGKSSRGHPMLMKVTLNWPSTPVVTMVRDFFAECQAHGVSSLMNVLSLGHGQDMSYDGKRLVGLRCGNKDVADGSWNFVYSITDNTILGEGYASSDGYDSPPWPCPTGNCSWRQRNGFVYDKTLVQTGTTVMKNSLEHSTVGYTTAGGYDFVAQVGFDEPNPGSLLLWKLNQAVSNPSTIVGQANGWPYPLHATHPSLSAKDGSGWVAVGMIGSGFGNAGVLDNEIILANAFTGAVCRIAHSRSCDDCPGGKWNYWAETHPQISNDGTRVIFDSDWENSNTVDMYVIDLRVGGSAATSPR